jgi:hypothetical protein
VQFPGGYIAEIHSTTSKPNSLASRTDVEPTP